MQERHLTDCGWALVIRTFVLVVLMAMPALARASCTGLSTANPKDLLALPGVNPFSFEWMSPGVSCTAANLDQLPAACTWRTTVKEDRMVGAERRIVLARAARPQGQQWDYVFVFGCVDGRVQSLLHDRFHPGAEIVSAEPDKIVVKGSDQPDDGPRLNRFVWNRSRRAYSFEPGFGPPPPAAKTVSCRDIATMSTDDLIAIPKDGFVFSHGTGCYSEDPENYPKNCGWKVTLRTDRMIGADRRLVGVSRDHLGGTGYWDDLFVFGCVSGRLAVLFRESFDHGAAIREASADTLILGVGGWGPNDPGCCPSRDVRMTYAWTEGLRSYVLRSVHFATHPSTAQP